MRIKCLDIADVLQQRTSPPPYLPERVAYARRVWEPIYGRPLSDAEIHRIIFNTSGLLRALFGLRNPAHVKPVEKECES